MKVVVIGGGVAAAHAALSLLERGQTVEMWDVGREESEFSLPGESFHGLKTALRDPVEYFLGDRLQGMVPAASGDMLVYPPARNFIAPPDDPLSDFEPSDFHPYGSFNRGGLANGWGANALSFDEDDLREWPINFADMEPDYREIYQRVAVAAPQRDDLTEHFSGVYPSQPPMALSSADERMFERYRRHRASLNEAGIHLGHSRLAVTTSAADGNACDACGRCLWGCPKQAIYNPARDTLADCERHRGFTYRAGRKVLSLNGRDGRITGIRFLDLASNEIREEGCDAVFLAAGALQSGAIFLRTLDRLHPELPAQTASLLDTRVVKLPYVAWHGIGRPSEPRQFQFNRLLMGLVDDDTGWPRYLHGELLNLNNLLYHPMIEFLPFDSRMSSKLFFALKSALGALTLFFPDRPSAGKHMALSDKGERWKTVDLVYQESAEQIAFREQAVRRAKRALWRLGCVPNGMLESPLGGGIHYGGTIPMGEGAHACSVDGASNLYSNLYIADGAAFPDLPSKSITLSLAAHAHRVVRQAGL